MNTTPLEGEQKSEQWQSTFVIHLWLFLNLVHLIHVELSLNSKDEKFTAQASVSSAVKGGENTVINSSAH